MKPIPKRLLIHSASLHGVTEDVWQKESLTTIAELCRIRIEPMTKLITDKQNRQCTLSAMLLYDCRNSAPQGVQFEVGQKLLWNGTEYRVETVEPLYDGARLHHLEVGLV
ncbi:MAG: hypothetical protein IJN57_05295 [Oscillospiraceae bacterium]|nr:hypothetical protein [Oscillospiraceae bacterium]